MTEYRLYSLNSSGQIVSRKDFVSTNDEAAVTHAKQCVHGKVSELWCGGRIVAHFELAGPKPNFGH